MTTTNQINEETQELIRSFHLTKKTLPILIHNELTAESGKPVLNTFARYASNHETPPFSFIDAKDVIASLIDLPANVHNPKYQKSPN